MKTANTHNLMTTPAILGIIVMALVLTAASVSAVVPARICVQGRLLDDTGAPVNTNTGMRVELFAESSGGTAIFGEDVSAVVVQDGMYSFTFGTNEPALMAVLHGTNTALWLEMQINSTSLTPRQELIAVPFALRLANTILSTNDVAIGIGASGIQEGTAVGISSLAYESGVAVGYDSDGDSEGVAIGYSASAYESGVAVGFSALGEEYGIAAGYLADGRGTNIAIGVDASAQQGMNRIAIGQSVTNGVDDSACLRGTLYLDGATGVYHRATFGSGSWAPLVGGWSGAVTNIAGSTTQVLYYSSGLLTNVVNQ